jgi:hypothetical protein
MTTQARMGRVTVPSKAYLSFNSLSRSAVPSSRVAVTNKERILGHLRLRAMTEAAVHTGQKVLAKIESRKGRVSKASKSKHVRVIMH